MHVLVVVPAHDEETAIGEALTAVRAALEHACATGVLDRADVVVAAHRCHDGTAHAARSALAGLRTGTALVVADELSETVGEVRDGAVRQALGALGALDRPDWLLSTDADSHVPLDWVGSLLRPAAAEGAVAVAGMVELVDWDATPAAREAYARIIEAGIVDADHHRHVYAANLAVRLDAYLAVGGFPAVLHGEETGLLAALVESGRRVTSTRHSVVLTSGRMPGRAALGLGALLGRLQHPERQDAPSPPRPADGGHRHPHPTDPTTLRRTP